MKIRVGQIFAALIVSVAVAGVLFLRDLDRSWRAPGPLAAETLVYIAPGNGTDAIARTLQEKGVIADAARFALLSRVARVTGGLKAGEYRFMPGMSVADVVGLLQSGRTWQRRLTAAEGLTSAEILRLVAAAEGLTGDAPPAPEGSLLPETYVYSYGDSRARLVERMRDAMQAALLPLWEARDPGLPLTSPAEAVVLASVVEKETGVAGERARIAGVFYNRLRIGMPLQSDPTVIYALTQGQGKLERALLFKDLEKESPYNTYRVRGLPPGPIANPGRAALEAVLKPEKNDYLYFVADGTGGHVFAKTLAEHNQNVARWRAINR